MLAKLPPPDAIDRYTAEQRRGYTVDDTCYPWIGYKGPRFAPSEKCSVLTDLETLLIQALNGMLVATNANLPEEFPGHSEAYLRQVARPRAIELLRSFEQLQKGTT